MPWAATWAMTQVYRSGVPGGTSAMSFSRFSCVRRAGSRIASRVDARAPVEVQRADAGVVGDGLPAGRGVGGACTLRPRRDRPEAIADDSHIGALNLDWGQTSAPARYAGAGATARRTSRSSSPRSAGTPLRYASVIAHVAADGAERLLRGCVRGRDGRAPLRRRRVRLRPDLRSG